MSPSVAYRYGSLKKSSLCRIIPRDHMSAFESICRNRPVSGEGRLSGAEYSNVPVFPDRTRDVCIISLDVPKSDSIARGINFPSSHVNNTFPGFKSRCNIDFSWRNASPSTTSLNKLLTSSAPNKWTAFQLCPVPPEPRTPLASFISLFICSFSSGEAFW